MCAIPYSITRICQVWSASKNGCFDVATKHPHVDDIQSMKQNIQTWMIYAVFSLQSDRIK